MKKWGIVVTVAYAVAVILLLPGVLAISVRRSSGSWLDLYAEWGTWLFVGFMVFCQGLLLFLSVDTSQRKLKPRTHILVSCAFAGFFSMVLVVGAVLAVLWAWRGDKVNLPPWLVLALPLLWVAWGVVFYMYARRNSGYLARFTSWLIKGSVLDLLIAVPAHVYLRRRDECCAPAFNAMGIVTGIAIMLMAFGPSVLFLLEKRWNHSRVRAVSSGK